jgi:hypothetical protein
MSANDSLPDDIETLKAMLIAAQAACLAAQAKARNAEAEALARALLIEQMKFTIAKLRHERFGQSSERGAVLEQLELRLIDMEEEDLAAISQYAGVCGSGRSLQQVMLSVQRIASIAPLISLRN